MSDALGSKLSLLAYHTHVDGRTVIYHRLRFFGNLTIPKAGLVAKQVPHLATNTWVGKQAQLSVRCVPCAREQAAMHLWMWILAGNSSHTILPERLA